MKEFFFYNAELGANMPNFMVCYCSGSDFNLDKFYNNVVEQFKTAIFTKDLVIISPAFNKEEINDKLFSASTLAKLKDKINSLQVLNVHSCYIEKDGNFNIKSHFDLKRPNQLSFTSKDADNLIEHGLYNIVTKRKLVVEASPNFHFIKPSGRHTNKFISVANILESASEISFIASSLLKLLPNDVDRIYVDTSGVYSLAYELANLLDAYNKSSNIISIDSFGSYGGIEEYQFYSNEKTLILISASASNNLFKRLNSQQSLEQASLVSVVMTQTNSQNQKVLIEFKKYSDQFCSKYFEHFDSYDASSCHLCLKEHSVPVALDKSRFIFDAPRRESYLPLAIDSDANLKELISLYKDLDAFRCLYDGVQGKKSQAPEYFIDVSKLVIGSHKYREKVANAVLRHYPMNADSIIYCKDSGAKELAGLIEKEVNKLGLKPYLSEGKIDEQHKPKNGIVVIAGCIQTGKSLLNISRDLRAYRELDLPITYIVGFAKLNSNSEYLKLQKDLTFSEGKCGHHKFHEIEKIILPISEHKINAWQKELEVLKGLSQHYSAEKELKSIIDSRMTSLRRASSLEVKGLGDELFLRSPNDKKMILGATFAFWDKLDNKESFEHQSTVYYTISSILQRLRTVAKKTGIAPLGEGYIIRQLDPLMFDRFNEGVIQACILRAAKPRELDYSSDDNQSRIVGSLIERMLVTPDTNESEGLPEFLMALCTKKLQIRTDHLLGLQSHGIDKGVFPFAWALDEQAKRELFGEHKELVAKF